MLREYEFKLTRKEAVEAITMWLEAKGKIDTPKDATTPDSTQVLIKVPGQGGLGGTSLRSLVVKQGRPLRIAWSVLEGEEP